jgi:hypothetical protein
MCKDKMMEQWPEIEYDDDGYPTDESIAAIESLPLDFKKARMFAKRELERCAEICCASYDEDNAIDIVGKPVIHASFSTGGWSGAETLIGLIQRRHDIAHSMLSWRRGGHYVFEFPCPPSTTDNMDG